MRVRYPEGHSGFASPRTLFLHHFLTLLKYRGPCTESTWIFQEMLGMSKKTPGNTPKSSKEVDQMALQRTDACRKCLDASLHRILRRMEAEM